MHIRYGFLALEDRKNNPHNVSLGWPDGGNLGIICDGSNVFHLVPPFLDYELAKVDYIIDASTEFRGRSEVVYSNLSSHSEISSWERGWKHLWQETDHKRLLGASASRVSPFYILTRDLGVDAAKQLGYLRWGSCSSVLGHGYS